MPMKPVIVICGTTGVGKSKLAIQLAQQISQGDLSPKWRAAKVLNADAMQVYCGLDVLTNKMPESERHGVEHLLMDFKQPGERYVVGDWVEDAMRTIEQMHKRAEVPIVVGGTSYWLQHLMFSNRLPNDPASSSSVPSPSSAMHDEDLSAAIAALPAEMRVLLDHLPDPAPSAAEQPDLALTLHEMLAKLDPLISGTWHWRDTRKVLRSLSIIKETGQRPSSLYRAQAAEVALPRYNTLCFWLHADMAALEPRLRTRVDDMLRDGLLEEVSALRRLAAANGNDANPSQFDYTSGIYQSIGFKEFDQYLAEIDPSSARYDLAVENMKVSTRQYAKRQVTWIRNKLIPAVNAARRAANEGPDLYALDATDLAEWQQNVSDIATRLATTFFSDESIPDPLSTSAAAETLLREGARSADPMAMLEARRQIVCSTCTLDKTRPVMIIEGEPWEVHCRTKVHRKLAKKVPHENASLESAEAFAT
ncbi:tRNA isopentenyltransferase [Peniophora sp. CONT]|nr:tRNA isopentenyltransferase [Peniophora sp. CONT]